MPKVFNGSVENAFRFSSKFIQIEELVISSHKNDIDYSLTFIVGKNITKLQFY